MPDGDLDLLNFHIRTIFVVSIDTKYWPHGENSHSVIPDDEFDAMNDPRNMSESIKCTKEMEGHAQGTISYTTSPVHNIKGWVDLSLKIQDLGADSLAIKDMAGLLKPYVAL